MLPTKQYSKNNTMEKTDFFLQAEKMYAEATARGTLFTKLLLFTKVVNGNHDIRCVGKKITTILRPQTE